MTCPLGPSNGEETDAKEATTQLSSQQPERPRPHGSPRFHAHFLMLYVTRKQGVLSCYLSGSEYLSSTLISHKQVAALVLATLWWRVHMRHRKALRPFQLWQLHGHVLQDPGSDVNISKHQWAICTRGLIQLRLYTWCFWSNSTGWIVKDLFWKARKIGGGLWMNKRILKSM